MRPFRKAVQNCLKLRRKLHECALHAAAEHLCLLFPDAVQLKGVLIDSRWLEHHLPVGDVALHHVVDPRPSKPLEEQFVYCHDHDCVVLQDMQQQRKGLLHLGPNPPQLLAWGERAWVVP